MRWDVISRLVVFVVVFSKQNMIQKATLFDSVFVSVDLDIPQDILTEFSRKTTIIYFVNLTKTYEKPKILAQKRKNLGNG